MSGQSFEEWIKGVAEEPERAFEQALSDGRQRARLYALEEALSAFSSLNQTALAPEAEAALAEACEALLCGEAKNIDGATVAAAVPTVFALQAMSAPDRESLPEALRAVVDRSLAGEGFRQPQLILQLSDAGLRAIRNVLSGLSVAPIQAVPVRSSTVADAPRRIEFQETVQDRIGQSLSLEYQAIRDADDQITLRFSCADSTGAVRVDLYRAERRIDSRQLQGPIQCEFAKLPAGEYSLAISGAIERRLDFWLQS